ncbi:MAG TPA: alpha/beta fold hydrolase [Gammaproteobacteria bacterium]
MFRAVLLSLAVFANTAFASDIEREKRLASEIIDSIMDGEALQLEAGEHEFLSIYMESDAESPKGAAIILHGRGYHPNWPDVVYPLRTGLPQHGWHTLAIQLPVMPADAKYYDYVSLFPEAFPRIEAAIAFLKEKDVDNIVLIAHSCGAHMAMAWLEYADSKDINAYIGIGMGATDYKQPMLSPFMLEQLKFPVLDIYGANEFPAVIKMAPERLAKIKQAGNTKSAQRIVSGANHYFTDQGEPLLNEVVDWLNQLQD